MLTVRHSRHCIPAAKRRPSHYYLAVGLQASLVGYMTSAFFAAVAYQWYAYYLVGYAVCLSRMYEARGAEPAVAAPAREVYSPAAAHSPGR